jgi:hypothetical protein
LPGFLRPVKAVVEKMDCLLPIDPVEGVVVLPGFLRPVKAMVEKMDCLLPIDPVEGVAMMPRFLRQVDTVFVQAIDSTFALDPDEGVAVMDYYDLNIVRIDQAVDSLLPLDTVESHSIDRCSMYHCYLPSGSFFFLCSNWTSFRDRKGFFA